MKIMFDLYETGFEIIDNNVFYYDRQILNADSSSFKVLNYNYAIDKKNAFCGDTMLINADINSFEALTHSLAKDKNQVYHFSQILKYADAKTIKLFKNAPHSLFYRDKNNVFQGENIVLGADIESFKPIGEMFAIDKNHVYRFSRLVKYLDPKTFELINNSYFKDKNNIYLNTFEKTRICKSHNSFEDLGSDLIFSSNWGFIFVLISSSNSIFILDSIPYFIFVSISDLSK